MMSLCFGWVLWCLWYSLGMPVCPKIGVYPN
jgi:hypothetical protein